MKIYLIEHKKKRTRYILRYSNLKLIFPYFQEVLSKTAGSFTKNIPQMFIRIPLCFWAGRKVIRNSAEIASNLTCRKSLENSSELASLAFLLFVFYLGPGLAFIKKHLEHSVYR